MISSKHFDYIKADKTFVAEISELQGKLHMIQVYPDACDAGFEMVSAKTGKIVRFVETKEVRQDDEIVAWEFKCLDKDHKNLKALIFND